MMKTCFQKSASAVALGTLLILCLTVITVLAQSKYAKRTDDAATHAAAAKALTEIIGAPDKAIPIHLINKAEAIGVFPYISSDSWSKADSGTTPAEPTLPGEATANSGALAVVKVSMRNMQFYPQSVNVKKGTVVEWKNDDLVPHTATSASFDSGTLAAGKSWRHTFTKAGEFSYTCTFHPMMKGVVTVK